jgi:SET domain-containing protein
MKKALIKNLNDDVYCRIKASKRHGVGVFAIKDIPKDTNPFLLTGAQCIKQKIINVSEDELKTLHPEVKKMVNDFYHKDDGVYGIPYKGLNSNDISFYMNTTNKPNIGFESSNKCSMVTFTTLRKIKKNEELLINYDDY